MAKLKKKNRPSKINVRKNVKKIELRKNRNSKLKKDEILTVIDFDIKNIILSTDKQ